MKLYRLFFNGGYTHYTVCASDYNNAKNQLYSICDWFAELVDSKRNSIVFEEVKPKSV